MSTTEEPVQPEAMPRTVSKPSVNNPKRSAPARPREKLPSLFDLITEAITALRVPGPASRKGVSAYAIKAYIAGNIRSDVNNKRLNAAFRSAVEKGKLIHTKGLVTASGSFKLPPASTRPKPQRRKKTSGSSKEHKSGKAPSRIKSRKPNQLKVPPKKTINTAKMIPSKTQISTI